MAVPICAASPAGWYGMPSHSLTDAGQLSQRDAADGRNLIMVSLSVVCVVICFAVNTKQVVDA
jgi:hypothetical protein